MRRTRHFARILTIAAATLLLAVPSRAYYHYVHYLTGSAPFIPVPEAFDLTALPNKTITFFASDAGLASYGANDTFGSVLSQLKDAAAAWNSIANSDLRVSFGGLEIAGSSQASATPAAHVVFQELPPGILGMGAPTVLDGTPAQTGQNGQFFPIGSAVVMLTNTTDPNAGYGPGPSYLEGFYTTAVHEFGHALGLQHTWTAAAMSQSVIRNTSRARPIDADDIAAILQLYGAPHWADSTGSISGMVVTTNGKLWNMASVVAIPPVGPAISTLTNPDGTYTISGLPPGSYYLYAHPLPQDALVAGSDIGLKRPVGPSGNPIDPTLGYFQTMFYPGTTDVNQATLFTVAAGQSIIQKNFSVTPRASIPVYDMVTWTYLDPATRQYSYGGPASIFLTPAFAGINQNYLKIYAEANSLYLTPQPTTATLLGPGTAPSGDIQTDGQYIAMDFLNQGGLTVGPRHLAMTFKTNQGVDLFVVPDAIDLVDNGPPTINSLTPNSDGSLTVAAAGLTPDSRIFFDGLQAAVTVPFASTDASTGSITVFPPSGASAQTATVTAFAADNQNSWQLQSASPVTFAYAAANAPQISSVTPSALPAGFNVAGTSAMIDLTASNTNFVSGEVTLGFGTSDIQVRRVWVLSPTHLVADVVVANNATVGVWPVTVISGFQVLEQAAAFQVLPANTSLPAPALPVLNAVSYASVLHDSDYASIFGSNLSVGSSTQVLLNGVAMPVLYASASQINFQIPAGFPAGAATLQVNNGSVNAYPMYLQIDTAPAVINVPVSGLSGVTTPAGVPLQVVTAGQLATVQVSNIDPAVVNTPTRVSVTLSGVPMAVQSVTAMGGGVFQVQFAVTQSFAGWQVPLVVSVDGSPSLSIQVTAK